MSGRETARQAAGERLLYTPQGARGAGPGLETAEPHRGTGTPIPSGMSRCRPRGGSRLLENTVKTHLRHLYRKLGAHSRHEAVQRAQAIGLLTASSRKS
jgi:Bacterial regulatory proteins, luxR family